jgi:hypothetical protein
VDETEAAALPIPQDRILAVDVGAGRMDWV